MCFEHGARQAQHATNIRQNKAANSQAKLL